MARSKDLLSAEWGAANHTQAKNAIMMKRIARRLLFNMRMGPVLFRILQYENMINEIPGIVHPWSADYGLGFADK